MSLLTRLGREEGSNRQVRIFETEQEKEDTDASYLKV